MSERKRANAPSQPPGAKAKKSFKAYRVPIVIVLVWLAIVGYQVAAQRGVIGDPGEGCPGHWHTMLDVHIDGEELTFDGGRVHRFEWHDQSQGGFHLHDDTGRVHFHPGTERCIPFNDALGYLGLEVDNDSVSVSNQFNYLTTEPVAGTYTTNDTHELRVYHAEWDYGTESRGDFKRVSNPASFFEKQTGNGDAVLITYVPKDVNATTIQAQMEDSGYIGDSYVPGSKSIFVPIMAATMFAGIGLLVWNKFRAVA